MSYLVINSDDLSTAAVEGRNAHAHFIKLIKQYVTGRPESRVHRVVMKFPNNAIALRKYIESEYPFKMNDRTYVCTIPGGILIPGEILDLPEDSRICIVFVE